MMRLEGKKAIVTGASRGIGRAISIKFAEEGADVIVNYIKGCERDADELIKEIKEIGQKSKAIQADVGSMDDVNNLVEESIKEFGHIDILVNNAGISIPALLHKMSEEQWDEVIRVNLKGTYNCIRAICNHMMGRKYGRIINVTSSAGLEGTIGQINYSAAKSGVLGVTKSAARELGRHNLGITVNAISPAAKTEMTRKILNDPKFAEKSIARVPMGRWAEPEEIAHAVAFLASDEACFITGQILCVDGGTIMR